MTTPDLNALAAERAKCLSDASKIIDRCRSDGCRGLNTEEKAEFDRLHDRATAIRRHLDRADAGPAPAPTAGAFRGRPLFIAPVGRAAERATDEYASAFAAYLVAGHPGAALQTDLADSGGYLAPPRFTAELVRELDDSSWFRRLANVLPPIAAPKITVPRRLTRPDPFVWSTEVAPPTVDTGLKVGSYSLHPHPLTGEFEVSADLLRAVPVLLDALRDEVAGRAGDAEEAAFLAGDGAGKPLGLFTPSTQGVGTDRDVTADVTAFETFRKLKLSLRSPYLRSDSLRWVLHPNAVRHLCGLKSTAGEPVWSPAKAAGEPDHIDGVPIEYSDNAPSGTGVGDTYASGDYFGLLGDLSSYDVQDGLDLSVVKLDDTGYARRNMAGYIVRRKVDGCPRVAEAFLRLKVQ